MHGRYIWIKPAICRMQNESSTTESLSLFQGAVCADSWRNSL